MDLYKEVLKYSGTRVFMFTLALTLGLIIVDLLHKPFWFYAAIKVPIDFTLNFLLSRWVFKKKKNETN